MEFDGDQKVRIGLTHFPLLSLGPGVRTGIWFAGCPLHCPACIAPEWQDPLSGSEITLTRLLSDLLPWLSQSDGVTISGGEPFAQPKALQQLLNALRAAGVSDILLYSGYHIEEIRERYPLHLQNLDALIDGPFMAEYESRHPWRGSGNQKLHILTQAEELLQRYERFQKYIPTRRRLQLIPRSGGVTVIGIPRASDIEELQNGTV